MTDYQVAKFPFSALSSLKSQRLLATLLVLREALTYSSFVLSIPGSAATYS